MIQGRGYLREAEGRQRLGVGLGIPVMLYNFTWIIRTRVFDVITH